MYNEINKAEVPRHVAIIMDGNGRWAKSHGLARKAGHQAGVKTVRRMLEVAIEFKIKYITLYTFSTENWNRPKEEVSELMNLMLTYLSDELSTMLENDVKLGVIGDVASLPMAVQASLKNCMEATKNNQGPVLTLALSYSARWEIMNALNHILRDVRAGILVEEEIEAAKFEKYLTTSDMPDPDLLIRTSGELRISNFLLWQLAYTELYFTDVLWPDFSKEHFYEALYEYQQRERRLGKTSEQIAGKNN